MRISDWSSDVCSSDLLAIALQEKREGLRRALPWLLMAAAFCALSLDEIATLHEGLSAALAARIDNSGLFSFAWPLPALALCLAGLACFVPFILRFQGLDPALLLGSAGVFLAGAIGLAMLGGPWADRKR